MGLVSSVKNFFTPPKEKKNTGNKSTSNGKNVGSKTPNNKNTSNKSTSNGKNTGSIKSNVKPATEFKKTVTTVNNKVVKPAVDTVKKTYTNVTNKAVQNATNSGAKSTSGGRAQLSSDARLQEVLALNKLKREQGNRNSIDYTGGVGNQYITTTRGGKKYNFKTDLATAKQRDQVIGTTGRIAQNLAFNNPLSNIPLQSLAGAYGGMQNARKQGTNPLAGGLKGAGSALGRYGKNFFTKDGFKYDAETEAGMIARGKDPDGPRDQYDAAIGLGLGFLSPSFTDLKKVGNVASNGISALTRGKVNPRNALNMGIVDDFKPLTESEALDKIMAIAQKKKKASIPEAPKAPTRKVKEVESKVLDDAIASAKKPIKGELTYYYEGKDLVFNGLRGAEAERALAVAEFTKNKSFLKKFMSLDDAKARGKIVNDFIKNNTAFESADEISAFKQELKGHLAGLKGTATSPAKAVKAVDEVPALAKQADEISPVAPAKKKRGTATKKKTTPSPAELKQQIVASQPPAVTPQKFNPASLGNEASINDYLRYGRQVPNIDLSQLMKQAPTSPAGGVQLLQGATRNADDIMAGFRKSSTPPVIDLKQADNLGAGTFRQVDDLAGQGATLGARQADDMAGQGATFGARQADDMAGQGAKQADDMAGQGAKQADDMAGQGAKQADDMAGQGAKADPFEPKSAEDIASDFDGADDIADVAGKKKRGLLGNMAVGTMVGVPIAAGLAAAWQRMNGGNSGYTEPAEEVAEEVASSSGSGRAGGSGGAGAGYGGGAGMLDPNMQDTGGYGTPYSEAEYQAYLANQDAYKQMVAQAMGQPSMANDIMAMLGQPSGAVLGDYSDLMAQLGINPNIPVGQLGQQLQDSGITMMPDNFMDYEQWASGFEQAGQALDTGQTDLQGALSFIQAQMQPQFDQAVKELNTQYEARLNALKEDLASRGLLNSGIYDQAVLLLNQDLSASLVALNAEHNANLLQMGMQYWGDSQDRAMQLRQMYMQEKQIAIENYFKQMQMQMQIGQINTENMQKAKDRQYEVALTLLQSELEKQAIMLKYGMDGMNMGNEQYLKGLNKQIPNVYNTNKNTNVNMNYN